MTPLWISDYDYTLPEDCIAKYPLVQRDAAKLLVYNHGTITDDIFKNVGKYLPKNTLLVYNDTKVIQARILFHKDTGAQIEVFCLEPYEPRQYERALGSQSGCTWVCMLGNARKWKEGALELVLPDGTILTAIKGAVHGNSYLVTFQWNNPMLSFADILDRVGVIPIPPYLNRESEEGDKTDYQTVYSRIKGSVAAPTAGLHFTTELLDDLRQQGVLTTEVTLHVGAGTFQPVKTEDANAHVMHTELISVKGTTIQQLLDHIDTIVAVGTTSLRTLESLYYIGEYLYEHPDAHDILVEQFVPYNRPHTLSIQSSLQTIIDTIGVGGVLQAQTQLMIEPHFPFRLVKGLITNFHQPKSTLLLLVDAFLQGKWKDVYTHALAHDYRFLSYGDANLYWR